VESQDISQDTTAAPAATPINLRCLNRINTEMNTVEKYCTHCKKAGHRWKDCWTLHGRPEKIQERQQRPNNNSKKPQEHTTALVKRRKKRHDNSDSSFSSSEEEEEEVTRTKTSRPARECKVTQVHRNSRANIGLDLMTLPIQEAKREKTSFLLDTGATLTLIKLRNLKDETPVREERIES